MDCSQIHKQKLIPSLKLYFMFSFSNILRAALFFMLLNMSNNVFAQPASSRNDASRSSRGKDFYFTFLPNFHEQPRDSANTRDSLFVFITGDKPTTGRITYRNRRGQVFVHPFSITNPAEIYTHSLTYGGFELEGFNTGGNLTRDNQNEEPAPQTFRVESDEDVTVYALNQARFTSDAMLVFPVASLGREYVVMAYRSDGDGIQFGAPDRDTPSQFAIVAVENNTEITITPRVPTHPNNNAFVRSTDGTIPVQRIVLQQGEAYLVQADTRIGTGNNDLTGSRVLSSKPVAVFGGHQRTVLPVSLRGTLSSRDHLLEQMPSVETWGKSVFLVPHAQPSEQTLIGTDIYRVLAAFNNTIVSLNGVVIATLNAGEFIESQLVSPGWITASDQVLVAQLKKSSNTGGGTGLGSGAQLIGDPFMMVIPTVEQYDKSYRFINVRIPDPGVRNSLVFTEHFVTLVVSTSGTNSMFLDESPIPASLFQPIVNSNYAYVNLRVNAGVHTARGDSAFGLYVYGYGAANSYGYIGGGKLRIIAPDRDAPRLVLNQQCFSLTGTVLDTLITDSRLERVTIQSGTFASVQTRVQGNVQLSVEQFRPYADSVRFSAQLINIYQDGAFAFEAKDSIGFFTRRTIPIFGFTVGLLGQGSTNTAPQQRFELPTGRSRSFPIVVTNYGATAQTITGIRFLQGGQGMRLSQQFPLVLPSGASDTLRIVYTALQDGSISDTLEIQSTCANRSIAAITINATTDRIPPTLTAQADPCGQIITLQSTERGALASGIETFTPTNLVNCTFRRDSLTAEQAVGRIIVTNPRRDAIYTIQARDSSGNITTRTDTIQGFTIELVGARETVGRFSETNISGTTNCMTIQYRNVGMKTFVFNSLAPQLNRYFSIPPSQLPLSIPPNTIRGIDVCFSPDALISYRDSLVLQRGCLGDTLVLEGAGIAPLRVANSRCDVPIVLRTLSSPSVLAVLNTAPNPASDKASVTVSVSDNAWIRVSITSSSGIELRSVFEGGIEQGETRVDFDVADLQQGVYFCTIQAGTKRVTRQMVIVR